MAPILLKGGTVLQHDADNNVSANKVDVLIEGNVIKQIEKNIDPTSSTEVLDCTNKIIAPGFVDTHHHVWQTQLKGRHADELLGPYMFTGNFTSSLFSPDDVLWGEIGGAMEAVDSGTTTVVDHAHMTYSEAHVRAGVAGFEASGLRGFFCLAPVMRVKNWTPKFELEEEMLPSWFKEVADKLPKEAPFTDGLMQPGMTFDIQGNVSKEVLVELFEKARKDGYKLFTAHALRGMISEYQTHTYSLVHSG